jgi:membrane protein YqaA with SNARE-associated domain
MTKRTTSRSLPPPHDTDATWLNSGHAGWTLAGISFVESVIAPILIDPFLIALIFAKRSAWLRFIAISIVFSVLGGIAGYILGALFYELVATKIITFYGLEPAVAEAVVRIQVGGFVFVLLGALTPIPYKVVAIASGIAQLDFFTFLFASIVGRVLRLGLVGWAAYMVGPYALPVVRRHLLNLAYLIGIILLIYLFLQIV